MQRGPQDKEDPMFHLGDGNDLLDSRKRHESIGEDFYYSLLALSDNDIIEEIIREARDANLFNTSQKDRLQFCLIIYNLIIAICYINFYGKDKSQSKTIIDKMTSLFSRDFCQRGGDGASAGIGTYVVDPVEIKVISSGIADNTLTGWGDLVGTIYDLRIEQYVDAFEKRFAQEISSTVDPVAKLFVKHFTGKSWESNFRLATFFHIVLFRYDKTISEMVVDALASEERQQPSQAQEKRQYYRSSQEPQANWATEDASEKKAMEYQKGPVANHGDVVGRSVQENVGCALAGTAYAIVSVLGIIIHVWTIILAFMVKGFFAAIITFILPVLAQIFWFFKVGANVGYTNNSFCIAIMVYAGLWLVVYLGVAISGGKS